MDPLPPIEFAQAHGVRLALQHFGDGDEWLVATPPLAQNIEIAWEQPRIAAMFRAFGRFSHFVHYDKRGTGASGRTSRVPGPDERVDDLRCVLDHLGIERAHLFGNSDGGPTSLLFAASYPERVASIVLYGSGATTLRELPEDVEAGVWQEVAARMTDEWGTPASRIAAGFAPSMADDPAFLAWHQRYERLSADAGSLAELMGFMLENDARGVLDRVHAPVLVLHRREDPIVPLARAREVADGLPDARLVVVEGHDHFGYAGDVDAWMSELEQWITGRVTDASTVAARPSVRIRTFGGFVVEHDGEPVPTSAWGSRLARTLCKRLAVARGWPVTRDELFGLLWPDEHERRVLGPRLSVQLSTVRRLLHGGVVADRETVRLDLDEVSVDLVELPHAPDDEVVSLVRGPFLPEDQYDDWAMAARSEVHAAFAAAARRVVPARLDSGRPNDAVEIARRLVEIEPLDLTAYDLLVDALVAAGNPTAATAAWEAQVDVATDLGRRAPDRPAGLG